MTKRKMAWLMVVLVISALLLIYNGNVEQRRHAKFGISMTAPTKEYRIDMYYLYVGEPMVLLFRVYDRKNVLVAEHTRESWPGAWFEGWDCTVQHCTGFSYSTGEVEPILLPPTWLDRFRAKLP